MKACREWRYRSTFSWPRHWLEVSGQLHAPAALPPGTNWIGGWVGPRAGLHNDKIPGLELRPLGRSARSQSLYRLRYPGSQCLTKHSDTFIFTFIRHRYIRKGTGRPGYRLQLTPVMCDWYLAGLQTVTNPLGYVTVQYRRLLPILWVMTPCSIADCCQSSGLRHRLRLQIVTNPLGYDTVQYRRLLPILWVTTPSKIADCYQSSGLWHRAVSQTVANPLGYDTV
jgi:hypothetical protein